MKDHALTSEPTALPLDASMLDGLPDPVLLVDANHEIVDFNRAAKQLFGADVLGAKLETTVASINIHEAIDSTLDGVPGTRTEMFLPYPIARNYELNVWRLPDLKSLGPAWAMVVLHDVTASKQAAQMRADFVANVSHELRSPLSSLLGFIETLRGPARDDEAATERFLKIMESEAHRMARLINDLLALSKLETEEHIRPEDPVRIDRIINQVIATLSGRARERGQNLILDIPASLTPILGDADELTQVFQNLIANAISYGHENTPIKIKVATGHDVYESMSGGISVTVVNQGDGIPADEIPRLTERFYRADKGRSRTMGGTGLGLAIVKHVVSRHRGHLDIQSKIGGETFFAVHLPNIDG